jgi:hypothetical protein
VVNGNVRVGPNSAAVVLGATGTTATVLGALVANTASITGLTRTNSLTVSGVVTAANMLLLSDLTASNVQATATLSAAGTSYLQGQVVLGADTAYTMKRRGRQSFNSGASTFVLGQASGHVFSAGGDMVRHLSFSPVRFLTVLRS